MQKSKKIDLRTLNVENFENFRTRIGKIILVRFDRRTVIIKITQFFKIMIISKYSKTEHEKGLERTSDKKGSKIQMKIRKDLKELKKMKEEEKYKELSDNDGKLIETSIEIIENVSLVLCAAICKVIF